MSFSATTAQVRARTKTVTRRRNWIHAKPGDLLQPVVKAMGLRPGEKVERIGGPIKLLMVSREPLDCITPEDCAREGYPGMQPHQFVVMFCQKFGGGPQQEVTRIEFEYVEELPRG